MIKEISSLQNPLVKHIVDLKSKAALRRKTATCVVEGVKEIEIAYRSGLRIESIWMERTSYENDMVPWMDDIENIYICTAAVMDKISLRDNAQKVVAVVHTRDITLDNLKLSPTPFILILENIEKPGNIGALLRTSDAANVDAILCCEMQTDIYNPNVIRNSLGCVFSKQIISCTNEEALNFCRHHHIQTYATYLHTETYYYDCNMTLPTAIIFGTENSGISDFWISNADHLIKIPMLGRIDSMNVSNSASILLYEVVRQRMEYVPL